MFAGHVGAALALGGCARRLNVGLLVFAALALDVVLWALVLAGVERAAVPPDFAERRYFVFTFPYSHGLVASLAWSLLAGGLTWRATRAWPAGRGRAALVVGTAVFSHWVLDLLVHPPELPVTGSGSPVLGLGLWDRLALALVVEMAITLVGLGLFLAGAALPRRRAAGLCVLVGVVGAMTVVGMTLAPAPSDMRQPAITSLVVVPLLSLLAGWLGRAPAVGTRG